MKISEDIASRSKETIKQGTMENKNEFCFLKI